MKGSFFQEKKGDVVIVFAICSSSACSNTLIGSFEESLCQRMKGEMPTVFRKHNSSARSNAPFATFLRVVFRTSTASLSTQLQSFEALISLGKKKGETHIIVRNQSAKRTLFQSYHRL